MPPAVLLNWQPGPDKIPVLRYQYSHRIVGSVAFGMAAR